MRSTMDTTATPLRNQALVEAELSEVLAELGRRYPDIDWDAVTADRRGMT